MNSPEIIAETDDYFVLNKPTGMATEPPSNGPTLREWLIEQGHIRVGEWAQEERCGVVHRLDTDTSGVMIWAKTPAAQQKLKELWQGRRVKKTYLTLVDGETELDGTIELAIERDNRNDRQTVALLPTAKSRPAITEYRRLRQGKVGDRMVSLIVAQPVTGRTHQIRVHFKGIGHPVIGDKLYGEKSSTEIAGQLGLNRQFLHALEICLPGGDCHQAPLHRDLAEALKKAGIEL